MSKVFRTHGDSARSLRVAGALRHSVVLNREEQASRLASMETPPPRLAERGSRTGRSPGVRATALALAGLLSSGGQATQAAQATAPKAKAAPVAQPAPV